MRTSPQNRRPIERPVGYQPFAGLAVPTSMLEKPTHPQAPNGHVDHSKDRNGVYIRIGDRVKSHADGGQTWLVMQVYCHFVVGLGDSAEQAEGVDDPAGWLDVFEKIDCADCEIVGHVSDFQAELKRIERAAATLLVGCGKAGQS